MEALPFLLARLFRSPGALLSLTGCARKGLIVFSDIGSESSPSGDLVPGGAAPYLKPGWQRRWHYAKEQG